MTECEHKDAYVGTLQFKTLIIEVFVCEVCERVRVEKHRAPK